MEKTFEKKTGRFSPCVDYRKLRPNNLLSDEFKHLFYLLYWLGFMFVFYYFELFHKEDYYHPMHCALDDLIPFCELFVIPYLLWFVLLLAIHVYTLFYDVEAFKRLMRFIMVTYSIAIVVFLLFPNCQELRPLAFERDNVLTRIMKSLYTIDTNTNVCPSIHVLGAVAVLFAAFDCESLKNRVFQVVLTIVTVLICISTVFLKQHSVIDVLAAVPVCGIGYYICYMKKGKRKNNEFKENKNSATLR